MIEAGKEFPIASLDMSTPSVDVSKALVQFMNEASQARKFHSQTLGKNVNPEYCLGDFLQLVADRNTKKIASRYGEYCVKAALAESTGATGGFAVPTELRDDLMGDVADLTLVRPRATVVPMGSATLNLPLWDATTATGSGVPPFWGGMSLSWFSENATLPENEGKFRQLELRANLIGGTVVTSAPLLQDAQGLEAWLRKAFARSLAWYEDYNFIRGDGAGQPLGMLNAGCAVSVNRQTNNQYTAQDGQNMFAQLYDNSSTDHALWLFSVTVRGQVAKQGNWWINGPMQQYGLPIFGTMKQPPLGTKGDVIAADCAMYIIGDRQTVTVDASPYTDGTMFKQNRWMWRVVERVDGQPMLNAALTVPDGAGSPNLVSPIVILN